MTISRATRRFRSCLMLTTGLLIAFLIGPRGAFATPAYRDAETPWTTENTSCRSQTFDLLRLEDLPSSSSLDDFDVRVQSQPDTQRYLPLVTIVMGFDGQPYVDTYDWASTIFLSEKSLAQYYADMSCGKFTFAPVLETSAMGVDGNTNLYDAENDGIIHVTLNTQKQTGWAVENSRVADLEMLNAFAAALDMASNYMDFSVYDSNGDGAIQKSELAVSFVVSGKNAARGGYMPKAEYIWPHAYSFSVYSKYYDDSPDAPVVNGTTVDAYIAIAESYLSEGELFQEGMGTLAHELGHYIGLPDYYHIGNSTYGNWSKFNVNYLSLMDNGCYGTDLQGNPQPFSLDMWSRALLGWVTPTVIDSQTAPTTIAGSLTNGLLSNEEGQPIPIAVQINTNNPNEFYIVENRRFTSWDENMGGNEFYPAAATPGAEDGGGGLVLWHVQKDTYDTYNASNEVNNYDHNPAVMPLFPESARGVRCAIGTKVDTTQPFWYAGNWGSDVLLHMYGTSRTNTPGDRALASNLVLGLQSGTAPVMTFHVHSMQPSTCWNQKTGSQNAWEIGSVTYQGSCDTCGKQVVLEVDKSPTYEDTLQPTATTPGTRVYTTQFRTDNYTESKEFEVPATGEDSDQGAWNNAYAELGEVIDNVDKTVDLDDLKPSARERLTNALDGARAIWESEHPTLEELQDARAELQDAWDEAMRTGMRVSIESTTVSGLKALRYTGKALKPKPKVVLGKKTLVAGTDYVLAYANNTNAGKATVTITGTADYKGKLTRKFTIAKAANTFSVTGKIAKVKFSKLKTTNQTLAVSKVLKYTNKGQGKKAFTKASGNKKITINAKTGKVTIKKGLAKGTYKVKVNVQAKGDPNHKASAKKVTITIRVA